MPMKKVWITLLLLTSILCLNVQAKPIISNISIFPQDPLEGEAVTVSCNVYSPSGIKEVTLYWSLKPPEPEGFKVMNKTDSIYEATIPAHHAGQLVYYWIEAIDNEGASSSTEYRSYLVKPRQSFPRIRIIDVKPEHPTKENKITIIVEIVSTPEPLADPQSPVILYLEIGGKTYDLSPWETNQQEITETRFMLTIPERVTSEGVEVEVYQPGTTLSFRAAVRTISGKWGYTRTVTITIPEEVITDTTPPVITNVDINPISPTPQNATEISAEVTDVSQISSVTLIYSSDGVTWTHVPMNPENGKYVAYIPPYPANTTITFKIKAQDEYGNTAETSLQSYTIREEIVIEKTGIPWYYTVIAIIVIGGIILIFYFKFMRRRYPAGRPRRFRPKTLELP